VIMKSIILWDVTPCSRLSCNRRLGGTYRLHLQSRRNNSARTSKEAGGKQLSLAFRFSFNLLALSLSLHSQLIIDAYRGEVCNGGRVGEQTGDLSPHHPCSFFGSNLTPWNRVVLRRFIVAQLVKKVPVFYGGRVCYCAYINLLLDPTLSAQIHILFL
jgi:hypothetical protein